MQRHDHPDGQSAGCNQRDGARADFYNLSSRFFDFEGSVKNIPDDAESEEGDISRDFKQIQDSRPHLA
jgi:hypothetical protein